MASAGDVRDLLEERPDLEPAIEAVLAPEPPFDFDDVALDSGAFGELVSRGVVKRTDDGYRVQDRAAVRRGLTGEARDTDRDRTTSWSVPTRWPDRLDVGLLAGAIALVVLLRLLPLQSVFHGGHVVLSSNDPYSYRYLVEQLLADPAVAPSNLGFGVSRGEPLYVTALWLATLALGGTKSVAGHVMAWYPVASAAVTALFLYALAVVVTDDRRIGLASIAMLAVIPGHALRTSLGFADHHAFDYVWFALTLLGLVVVAREARAGDSQVSPTLLAGIAAVAVGVAAQTLAWDNSPIILAAVGGYLAIEGVRAVLAGDDPARSIGPVVVGTAAGAALAWLAHEALGWHTTLVASAPTLLAIGGAGVLVGAVLFPRLGFPVAGLAAVELFGLVFGALALRTLRPAFWTRLTTSLQNNLLAPRPIAEVEGLFADSGGWLLLLGFALFIGVPYLVWASARATDDARWLPPVTYAWYFLLLAVIQVRFVGELAPVLSLFAGLGLVHLAERIDVAKMPAPFTDDDPPELTLPNRRQFGALALLFLLVASLGMVQVPVKTSQVTVPPAQSDAAFWMADYSDEHGMEYPENYVFSEWGWSRLYNYYVNGQSRSYGYAQSNFQTFVDSTDPGAWYERLGNRRGFLVTTPKVVGEPRQLGTRLHRNNGAGTETSPALAHYRLVHITGGGTYKVFTVVPGAVIQGVADANATVTARTDVTIQDVSFTYERMATANPDGRYSVRVAHPGTYTVAGTTARVNESAVRNGTVVST